MNPILANQYHIPDVEAHVFNGVKIYLYGSQDNAQSTAYCSSEYRVFSSEDMVNFDDHGISFSIQQDNKYLYAPDCIKVGAHYYLYYCTNWNEERVAVSDFPWGPFQDIGKVDLADGDGIDPAVFVDEDGTVYYYWGQFQLRGGKLKSNMRELDKDTVKKDLLDENIDGFHEGACIRKRGNLYYMVYTDISRGKATCLSYAVSASPLGPYEKKGTIIDNNGCDPSSWNNHGSICEINDQWYVFYHRSSQNSKVRRRVCAEPIFFDDNGLIREVPMTTQGAEPPISSARKMETYRACFMQGKVHTMQKYQNEIMQSETLDFLSHEDWAAYKYIDFSGKETGFRLWMNSLNKDCKLVISEGSFVGRHIIGECVLQAGTTVAECSIKVDKGVKSLYLQLQCSEDLLLATESFVFLQD